MILKYSHFAAALVVAVSASIHFRVADAQPQRVRAHRAEAPQRNQGGDGSNTSTSSLTVTRENGPLPAGRNGEANGLRPARGIGLFPVARVDKDHLIREDEENERRARESGTLLPYKFAVPNEVSVSPATDGEWETTTDGRTNVWRFRTGSPEAESINLGFSRYFMPTGGVLYLYDANSGDSIQSYTSANNADHGELWTGIILADEVVLEVNLPSDVAKADLELHLTKINVGYRGPKSKKETGRPGLGGGGVRPGTDGGRDRDLSGSCNVDVICSEGDDWRSEIPSVATYSTGGSAFCTGFMVNNVNQDQDPLFQTAYHCGMRANNAASLVVYWNFETTVCGINPPNGNLNTFQSGATLLAESSDSDMTLLRLTSSPNPAWKITFAGFDANEVASHDSVVAIHHPSTDEKRISFENDATTTTSYSGTNVPGSGTHIRVEDWEVGTTEPGSSGSPLFDATTHRVIGQLHGGSAACGNDLPDWYGKVSYSWTRGLSDHLDPQGTGQKFADTLDPYSQPPGPFPVLSCTPSSVSFELGGSAQVICTVSSNNGYTGSMTFSCPSSDAGCAFSPSSVSVPANGNVDSTLTVTGGSLPAGNYGIVVEATDGPNTVTSDLSIAITEVGANNAVYSRSLGAPTCPSVGISCNTMDLIDGRGTVTSGGEINMPNTLDDCADGNSGTYHDDESLDRLVVKTVDGEVFATGSLVEIEATVYAWSTGSADSADFFYAADANSPVWNFIATVTPPGGGVQKLTKTYTLPSGPLQAVRVQFRYQSSAEPCAAGAYNDRDDVAFAVDNSEDPSTEPPTPTPQTEPPTPTPQTEPPTPTPQTEPPTPTPQTEPPTPTPQPQLWATIFEDNFENGWGNFADGGADAARRSDGTQWANSGLYALRIRDNTATSVITAPINGAENYSQFRVSFFFNPRGMNANEDFWLQTSVCGGSWTTIETWTRGSEWFSNGQWYQVSDTPGADFPAVVFSNSQGCPNVQFRFRCDASANNDRVYIDDVLLEGMQ